MGGSDFSQIKQNLKNTQNPAPPGPVRNFEQVCKFEVDKPNGTFHR